MKKSLLTLCFVLLSFSIQAGSYMPWRLGYKTFKIDRKTVEIRIGYLVENGEVAFKGNILYYQGLGDSMLNHDPLFESLVNNGYRVIAFDYMGQGGSEGTMNDTRISNINELGDKVIKLLSRKNGPDGLKYHIIGWSTGGLAAYQKAYQDGGRFVKSVTLIAPGIVPNYIVGEGLFNFPIDEISMRTLTTNTFEGVNDPHEDRIFPRSPVYVPAFAFDLQCIAKKSRSWRIDPKIKGLVLLSGADDTYVDARKTKRVLSRNAKHFGVKQYAGALHEIDNEVESIASDVRLSILNFLK